MDAVNHVVPIIPSASVLLVRDGNDGLEVLMMERANHLSFAAGAFVFPGGKLDPSDSDYGFWSRRIHDTCRFSDFAYRMAAIRELAEETGILLASQSNKKPAYGPKIRHIIHKYTSAPNTVRRALDRHKIKLMPASLVPFAHWITPEGIPRRFDTRFYIAEMPYRQFMNFKLGEATRLLWCRPSQLLADAEAQNISLMFPTRMNLMKLARSTTVKSALIDAASYPNITIEPNVKDRANPLHLNILKAAGYPAFDMAKIIRILPKSEKIARGKK